jgi:quercetin dioxygenase-like cupin family protein
MKINKIVLFILYITSSCLLTLGIQVKTIAHGFHENVEVININKSSVFLESSEAASAFFKHLSSDRLDYKAPSNFSELTFDFPTIAIDSNPPLIMGPAGEMFSFSKRKENYTLSESISPVGAGPAPHIHKGYGEFFYLPEGNVKFWVGDKTYQGDSIPGKNAPKSDVYSIVTKPGDLLYVPPNTVHGFEVIGDKPVRIVFIWKSNKIVDYFQEVGQPVADPQNPPEIEPQNKELFVSSAPKYGISQSRSFDEYVNRIKDGFPFTDNNSNELKSLLAPDLITEGNSNKFPNKSSLTSVVLIFGGLSVVLILKQKSKNGGI